MLFLDIYVCFKRLNWRVHLSNSSFLYCIQLSALVYDIQSMNEEFMRMFTAANSGGIGQTFTTDCKLLAPQQETLSGQEGYQELWKIFDISPCIHDAACTYTWIHYYYTFEAHMINSPKCSFCSNMRLLQHIIHGLLYIHSNFCSCLRYMDILVP